MPFVVEHKPGTREEDQKSAERKAKHIILARSLGLSYEEFRERTEEIKEFLTIQEMEARKRGTSTIKRSDDDLHPKTG